MIKEFDIEFKDLLSELGLDEIDDELTKDDIELWGYSSWEEFWESNI